MGFEPITSCVTNSCSPVELPAHRQMYRRSRLQSGSPSFALHQTAPGKSSEMESSQKKSKREPKPQPEYPTIPDSFENIIKALVAPAKPKR